MNKLKIVPIDSYTLKFNDLNHEKKFIKYVSEIGSMYIFWLIAAIGIFRMMMIVFIVLFHLLYGSLMNSFIPLMIRVVLLLIICVSTSKAGSWSGMYTSFRFFNIF